MAWAVSSSVVGMKEACLADLSPHHPISHRPVNSANAFIMMPRENLPCCDMMLVELLNVQATTVRIVTARPPATNPLLLLFLPLSSFASSVSCSPVHRLAAAVTVFSSQAFLVANMTAMPPFAPVWPRPVADSMTMGHGYLCVRDEELAPGVSASFHGLAGVSVRHPEKGPAMGHGPCVSGLLRVCMHGD
ncbi:hypothetical protein IG631_21037 [Alternaria alternata]|nr:hypothetical protein IG631_21037 [Alternaria alternata]